MDKAHYHFLVEASGKVVKGLLPPESNIPLNGTSLQGQANGSYMAHCGGGNSFTIGVALCGMQGKGPNGQWRHPLNEKQVQAACKLVAQLCQRYGIALSEATVYTHYEFGLANPKTPSAGKIDISVLPFAPHLSPAQVGPYLRHCIAGFLR
jgi:N-acetyl-anhydromuramyl-L-alanine amidase AmpD